MKDTNQGREMLPDEALGVLFDRGVPQCVRRFPELGRHQSLLRQMRWAEAELTDRMVEAEDAAHLLQELEAELLQRLAAYRTLQPYTAPRRSLVGTLWSWINWQRRRMRLRLSTQTLPPSPCIISACSSRLPASVDAAPTDSWRTGSASTTPASPGQSTLSGQSTETGSQG